MGIKYRINSHSSLDGYRDWVRSGGTPSRRAEALVRKRVKGCKTIKASQVAGARSVYYNGDHRELVVDLGTKGRHSIRFARG